MTLVVDASVVTAALIDAGPDGSWGEQLLGSDALVAPHLLPVEVANVLRRAVAVGEVSADSASLAHSDFLGLRVDLFDYEPVAERVWSCDAASAATTRGMSPSPSRWMRPLPRLIAG